MTKWYVQYIPQKNTFNLPVELAPMSLRIGWWLCQSLHVVFILNPRPDYTVQAQNQSFFKGPTSPPPHVLPFVCGSPLVPHGLLNRGSKCCLASSHDQMMYWCIGCIVAHTCGMGDNWRIVSCFDRMHARVVHRAIFWMFTSPDSKK